MRDSRIGSEMTYFLGKNLNFISVPPVPVPVPNLLSTHPVKMGIFP